MPPTTQQPVDQQALDLTHAIALQESGHDGKPDYNAVGDAGTSKGAYQWQPGNFEAAAKAAGLDPNDFSSENQDKVAYSEVKGYKDKGYDPGEIASLWNSGSPNNWQNHSGTTTINGKTISYDTPAYVKGVQNYYNQIKGSQETTQDPTQPPTSNGLPQAPTAPKPLLSASDDLSAETPQAPADNLGTDLSSRLQEGTQAASAGIAAASKGDVLGAASGALQTAGVAGGAIGDVVNRGLELIPGVKQVEGLLGQGVGALAQTPTGQKVAQSIQDFSTAHPELSKDIGAGFNIVTAIPILRGLGTVASIGGDAVAQGLKGMAEKSFVDATPDIIGSTKAGARFIEANPTVAKDMVDRRLVGDISNGEFTTKAATQQSWNTVKDMNSQVKSILDRPEFATEAQDGQGIAKKALAGFTDRTGNVVEGIPQSGMTAEDLIANAKKLDPNNSLLWDKFEAGQANWQDINNLRSSLDSKVKKVFIGKAGIDSPEVATSKENGALLSGAMRDSLQTAVPQTAVPFGEMSKQFKIQKALEFMNGKKVKPGGLAKLAGHVVGTGTGGTIGGVMGGAPGALIGGMIGDRTAGAVADKLAGKNIVQGILKKTGVKAIRTPLKKGLLKIGATAASSESQKANKP